MDTRSTDHDDLPEQLPAALRARLDARSREVSVDPAVDEAVLSGARAYFATRDVAEQRRGAEGPPVDAGAGDSGRAAPSRSARLRARWPGAKAEPRRSADRRGRRGGMRWAAGVAAAAVVLAAFLIVQPVPRLGPFDPDDIDRSGRVDILDAFALARMRAEGGPVTAAEIDALAMRVVALEPRQASR